MDRLYQILEYNMTRQQAKAFKVALIWEELTKKLYPGEQCGRLNRKGDPRKSILFKYCYKLVRTMQGFILDDQYRYYIRAQLDTLKNYKIGDCHANINPGCLVGKKAWWRWITWAKKMKSMERTSRVEILPLESKIKARLKKTKEFLLHQFKRNPTKEDICKAFENRTLIRWIVLGKVCGYYAVLSPHVAQCLGTQSFDEAFRFDLQIYKSHITPEVEKFFKNEFN